MVNKNNLVRYIFCIYIFFSSVMSGTQLKESLFDDSIESVTKLLYAIKNNDRDKFDEFSKTLKIDTKNIQNNDHLPQLLRSALKNK